MKKGDVGMTECFSKKVRKQGMNFQLPATQKLCQDACQCLMLHPMTLSESIPGKILYRAAPLETKF